MTNHPYDDILSILRKRNVIKSDGSINSNVNKILSPESTTASHIMNVSSFLNTAYDKLSLSMRIKLIQNGVTTVPICEHPNCNNPVIINRRRISKHCSSSCARTNPVVKGKYDTACIKKYGTKFPTQSNKIKEKSKNTCQEKYGADSPLESRDIQEKIKQTNLNKYGCEVAIQAKEVREKIKQTNIERYGSECVLSNTTIHEKTKNSLKQNYNVEYPLQSNSIMNKKVITCKKRYNVNHWSESTISVEAREKLNNPGWLYEQHITLSKPLTVIGEELNVYYGTVANYLHHHGYDTNYNYISSQEKKISNFISELGIQHNTSNRKIISPHELDIYIPEHKLAIEFNGNYWHSEIAGKDKNYHLNKTNMCKERGIQLIHVLESEWLFKKDIIKSRISSFLGHNKRIFARKCMVVDISKEIKAKFLNDNHLQGNVGSNINYGLLHDNVLVALMTFGNPRFSKKYEYELLRFSNAEGVNVVGGASKLFKHFIRNINPNSVVSYGDLRYGSGKLYENLGFEFSHNSKPNCHYFHNSDTMRLYSRIKFQKHKLESQLKIFDASLSAWQNLQNNGYNRIWDCGSSVWVWGHS